MSAASTNGKSSWISSSVQPVGSGRSGTAQRSPLAEQLHDDCLAEREKEMDK
jgi:hypothetical protein